MRVVGQAERIVRCLTQSSMGSPEVPFGNVARISVTIYLFQISEHIHIWGIAAQPDMHNRVPSRPGPLSCSGGVV